MNGQSKPFEPWNAAEPERLQLTLQAAGIGTWELHSTLQLIRWDECCKAFFGFSGDDVIPYTQLLTLIHADDREQVIQRLQQALTHPSTSPSYTIQFRTVETAHNPTRWLRCRGNAYTDDQGKTYRCLSIVDDVTQTIQEHHQLTELAEERFSQAQRENQITFRNVTDTSPTGLWLSDEAGGLIYLNKTLTEWTGMPYEALLGTGWANAIIEEDRQQSAATFLQAVSSRTHYDTQFRIKKGDGRIIWCQAAGDPYYREDGSYAGYVGYCMDIDELVSRREALQQSEAKFRSLIEQAPVATGLYVGKELIIEIANELILNIWGKGDGVLGKPLAEALPELQGQPFLQILDNIFTTGQPYQATADRCDLVIDGQLQTFYFNFTYKPLVDNQGQVYAILNMAIDVTEQVTIRQKIEESDLFTRSVFFNSPVAKVVFVDEDMTIRMVNENMLAMLGRTDSIIGQPFMEAMPELVTTPLMDRLRHVFTTGETYFQPEEQIALVRYGQSYTGYYNYIYKALRNLVGEIYGIIVTATEVTQQVLARQQVDKAEAALRGAVELAELATWSMDIPTGKFHYSARFMDWLGFAEATKSMDEAYNPLPSNYRQRVASAIAAVIAPGSSGLYENEHPIINRLSGQTRIIHAQAQVFYDSLGKPALLSGTAQDITEQRNIQLALEQLVQERTEELETTNEELQATNDELNESNDLLIRSNQNLQQFAYVASHDLQEPLRKIQSFGDLLKSQYANQLGKGVDYLERMQLAASRMSVLIKDLLSFSRISTQRDTSSLVPLTQILEIALTDLDLMIQETGAVIEVDSLPTVNGDASQLGQLFQNLLSNALKFRRPDTPPHIRVSAQTVSAIDLPPAVRPTRTARDYYRIDVADNGIGFDEKYIDRIFQVFQRLHGKSEFAGTGIGLAICEKVAANHGGAIMASSQLGQGATFSIYLPV